MRRQFLVCLLGGLTLLSVICAAGTARWWASQGGALVMSGARDVRVVRQGVSQLHLTYRLPAGQTVYDFRRFLSGQGWQRIVFPNYDRTTLSFARAGWPEQIREILVMTIDPQQPDLIDLQFGRCLRPAWIRCF
jgi:hypothetical protein